jgi:hypothetical protein
LDQKHGVLVLVLKAIFRHRLPFYNKIVLLPVISEVVKVKNVLLSDQGSEKSKYIADMAFGLLISSGGRPMLPPTDTDADLRAYGLLAALQAEARVSGTGKFELLDLMVSDARKFLTGLSQEELAVVIEKSFLESNNVNPKLINYKSMGIEELHEIFNPIITAQCILLATRMITNISPFVAEILLRYQDLTGIFPSGIS